MPMLRPRQVVITRELGKQREIRSGFEAGGGQGHQAGERQVRCARA